MLLPEESVFSARKLDMSAREGIGFRFFYLDIRHRRIGTYGVLKARAVWRLLVNLFPLRDLRARPPVGDLVSRICQRVCDWDNRRFPIEFVAVAESCPVVQNWAQFRWAKFIDSIDFQSTNQFVLGGKGVRCAFVDAFLSVVVCLRCLTVFRCYYIAYVCCLFLTCWCFNV